MLRHHFPELKVEKIKAKFRFERLGRNGVRVWHLGNMWVQELARGSGRLVFDPVQSIRLAALEKLLACMGQYKVGFKMFLGVTASVTNWDADGTCCSIVLEDNPLVDFVELPDTCQGLYYCNILSGVIRGALEMVSMKTEVTWVRDMLRGDDAFELQVKLLKQVPEEYPYKDDE
ncbi:hypothetical protein FH972_020410 [Carpinus fangiana]|uniref:Trafficking protein particle complex subunit n=1 Tax=Carpinus fangiana TaxID=176857 RepID=A0A5N6RUP7_9ROSI|nr:hypothetical protein FH972_020410 [Carpinus fangiana]